MGMVPLTIQRRAKVNVSMPHDRPIRAVNQA